MQIPRKTNRYCPFCNSHTEHKVKDVSTGGNRGSLKRGSKQRAAKRGKSVGMGNQGRWSKPAVSKFKRKTKTNKKTRLMYTCQTCGKAHHQNKGKRAGRVVQK